ncbi:MAG TPA: hypothetical protein VFV99_19815, partial [Kofleriaceae bacterium]|nr:hypothetical protein [Kofleriaceae bacterium]
MRKHAALLGALLLAVLPACPSHPRAPRVAPAADVTVPIEGAIRGVAATSGLQFAAVEANPSDHASALRAFRGVAEAWHGDIAGSAGPIAATDKLVVATSVVGAGSQLDGAAVRGEPAAAIRAFDATSGAVKWTRVFDSTEWALATSIAVAGDGVIVGGTFGGTLRAGKHVVSSAGGS